MIIRYATAITSGTFITLSLFYVMQSLIAMGSTEPVVERPRHKIGWVRVIKDDTLVLRDLLPVEPIDPPPPLPPTVTQTSTIDPIHVTRVPPPVPGGEAATAIFSIFDDGPLIAVVRVQPAYPVRAAQQGLEGWVIVQFDVNPDGTVSNVSIVESSHQVFENAAIKAALRFRYKARVVDGIAQTSHGLRNKFRFEMERG